MPLADSQPRSSARFAQIFPSIMLPMSLAVLDQTIVATALPAIAGSMGSPRQVSWVVVSYLVATTIAAPVYGRLGDAFGRKRLMLMALPLFMAASLLCALSTTMPMLIASRALQGLGGGGLMTLSQALIGEAVTPRDRGRYQGYLAAVVVSTSTIGPVLGGLITQHFGWPSVFLFNLPVGLVAWFMVLRLPARAGAETPFRFDLLGLMLFAGFIVSTLLLLQHVQRLEFDAAPIILGSAAVSGASLLLLIYCEKRTADPLLPVTLFRNPSISRSDAMAACHGALIVSLMTFMPIYYRVVHGGSAGQIGILLLPMTICIGVGSMLTGRTISRTGRTAVFPSLAMIVAAALLISVAMWSPRLTVVQVSWALGLVALCMGTVMSVVQVTVQSAAGMGMLGAAAASVQFSRSLGAAFGTAIVAAVLFTVLTATDPHAANIFGQILLTGPDALNSLPAAERIEISAEIRTAFRAVFFVVASFAVLITALAWSLPLRRLA